MESPFWRGDKKTSLLLSSGPCQTLVSHQEKLVARISHLPMLCFSEAQLQVGLAKMSQVPFSHLVLIHRAETLLQAPQTKKNEVPISLTPTSHNVKVPHRRGKLGRPGRGYCSHSAPCS